MSKKNILITICVLLIIAVGAGILFLNKNARLNKNGQENDEFLKSLKGEIVFVRRDGLYLNIYKINADGTGEKMLYHHENKMNSNAGYPIWSDDSSKIYFQAMTGAGDSIENYKWKIFEMSPNGENVKITEDKIELPIVLESSKEKDILVQEGSIYYLNEKKEKVLVFRFQGHYDSYESPGALLCSWSPDKQYIIFILDGYITIISKDGTKMARIAQGGYPNWKY